MHGPLRLKKDDMSAGEPASNLSGLRRVVFTIMSDRRRTLLMAIIYEAIEQRL